MVSEGGRSEKWFGVSGLGVKRIVEEIVNGVFACSGWEKIQVKIVQLDRKYDRARDGC